MADLDQAIVGLLRELIDGAPGVASVLHSRDAGLLASLDALTARDASARPGGRSSVAAHVDHLLDHLELLNRWAAGDDPGAAAGDATSWTRHDVSEHEWNERRAALRREARRWIANVATMNALDGRGLSRVLASIAHLAYHLGAIRQVAEGARGPQARN